MHSILQYPPVQQQPPIQLSKSITTLLERLTEQLADLYLCGTVVGSFRKRAKILHIRLMPSCCAKGLQERSIYERPRYLSDSLVVAAQIRMR